MTSSGNATSFRKKSNRVPNIAGTRLSSHNAQLLTSTGISSLDFHLGGGIPVGTVVLIEEDRYHTYSQLLVKYFIAEGVINRHAIYLVSKDTLVVQKIIKDLPSLASGKFRSQEKPNDELKIAWRYQEQKTTETFNSFCHSYNLSKIMPAEIVDKADITVWNPCEPDCDGQKSRKLMDPTYKHLLQKIKCSIKEGGFKVAEKSCHTNILRLAISSIGSPLWATSESEEHGQSIVRFLYLLRSILRSSFAVAIVTIPSLIIENLSLLSKICQVSDFVVKLESFVGSDKKQNPLFKDFDGLIHIVKLPILNTFAYQVPTADLAFKLRRKNFQIEWLHLPPDIEEPTGDQGLMCGAPSKLLDF